MFKQFFSVACSVHYVYTDIQKDSADSAQVGQGCSFSWNKVELIPRWRICSVRGEGEWMVGNKEKDLIVRLIYSV